MGSKKPIAVATPSAKAELKAKENALFAEKRRNPIAKAAEKESMLRTTANKRTSQNIMIKYFFSEHLSLI